MHEGVTGFLGGRLTFADLGQPKRILEVGYVVLSTACWPRFISDAFEQGRKWCLGNPRREGLP